LAAQKKLKKTWSRVWDNIETRRRFFCYFAEQLGFDPMVPENWTSFTRAEIEAYEVSLLSPSLPSLPSIIILTHLYIYRGRAYSRSLDLFNRHCRVPFLTCHSNTKVPPYILKQACFSLKFDFFVKHWIGRRLETIGPTMTTGGCSFVSLLKNWISTLYTMITGRM